MIAPLRFLCFAFIVVGTASADTPVLPLVEKSPPENPNTHRNWGEAINGLLLSIDFAKPAFPLGEAIVATVTVKNVGEQHSSPIQSWWFERDYRVFITRDRGQAVAPLPQKEIPFSGHVGPFSMAVGSEAKFDVRLDTLYDFGQIGEYVVTIARIVPAPTNAGVGAEIKSGNAIIRVVQGTGEAGSNASLNSIQPPTSEQPIHDSVAGGVGNQPGHAHSPARPGNSASVPQSQEGSVSPAMASASPSVETNLSPPARKIGAGIMAALAALLLVIVWRAARR